MINVLDYLYKHVSIVLIFSIWYDVNMYFLMQVPNIEINPVDAMGRTPMDVSVYWFASDADFHSGLLHFMFLGCKIPSKFCRNDIHRGAWRAGLWWPTVSNS
jgi:hypothetical protein